MLKSVSSSQSSLLTMLACVILMAAHTAVAANVPKGWHYLQNDQLKLGVNLDAGASIGWLSTVDKTEKNLLNTYDVGRYVQQSYYGDEDGSNWNGNPWRYNPVQGGGWRGAPSQVMEFRADSPVSLYTKTRPRHWATGASLEEVTMEQWITLEGPVVRMKIRLSYDGALSHKKHHQELPAFFVDPSLDTLVCWSAAPGKGAALARLQPGEKNEYVPLAEPWVAWVNPSGFALGIQSPGCPLATCYRVPGRAACSYVAPLQTFALTPGLRFEHEMCITTGTIEEILSRFSTVRSSK